MFTPIGYFAPPAGAAGFDPTLGGTLTPYMWYDFTDSSTMTFSSGTNIEAIYSKGTNTGELRKSPTSGFIAPVWNGSYTRFYGGSSTHGKLCRRYSTDGTDGSNDTLFQVGNSLTFIAFFNPLFTEAFEFSPFISMKSYNLTNGPDEYNMLMMESNSPPSDSTRTWTSTNTATYPNIMTYYWNFGSRGIRYSFSGATPAGWNSWVSQQNGSSSINAGRTWNNKAGFGVGNYGTTNTAYENFTIGGRSRDNSPYGANVELAHVVLYSGLLTTQNIDDLITDYETASGTLLNQVNN